MTGFISPKYIAKALACTSSFIPLLSNPIIESCMHYLLQNSGSECRRGIYTEYKTTFQSLSNIKYQVGKHVAAVGVVVVISTVYMSTSEQCSERDMICYHPTGYDGPSNLPLGVAAVVIGGALAFNSFMDMHYKFPKIDYMFGEFLD